MNTEPTTESYKTYVVTLQADSGRRVYYYTCAASAERAKALACEAELAPPCAVLSVRGYALFEGLA